MTTIGYTRRPVRFPLTQLLLDNIEPDDNPVCTSEIAQDFGVNEQTLTRWSKSDEAY
jgi:hypothetical protein